MRSGIWRYPQEIKGIHLTDVGFAGSLVAASDETLTPSELEYKRRAVEWQRMEGAYIHIHSTKPQTLAYMLSDSPAGMAAWIVEKYHAWSDWPLLTAGRPFHGAGAVKRVRGGFMRAIF